MPYFPLILSYIADVVVEKIDPVDSSNIHICMNTIIPNKFNILYNICINELKGQGFKEDNITCIYYLNCRYQGNIYSYYIMCSIFYSICYVMLCYVIL